MPTGLTIDASASVFGSLSTSLIITTKNELSFKIEDLYDDKGKPTGSAVTFVIPLDFK